MLRIRAAGDKVELLVSETKSDAIVFYFTDGKRHREINDRTRLFVVEGDLEAVALETYRCERTIFLLPRTQDLPTDFKHLSEVSGVILRSNSCVGRTAP